MLKSMFKETLNIYIKMISKRCLFSYCRWDKKDELLIILINIQCYLLIKNIKYLIIWELTEAMS